MIAPASMFNMRLLKARRHAGYPNGSVAARAMGMSIPTYNSWENGSRTPRSHEKVIEIAGFFGVDPQWLITGVGHEPDEASDEEMTHRPAEEAWKPASQSRPGPVVEVMQVTNRGPGKALVKIEKVLPWDVALRIMELAERGSLDQAD